MQYAYRKLRGRITEVFGTQAAFALALGISKNSVSKKTNRKDGVFPVRCRDLGKTAEY